ncbi:Acyl-CoA dehydrogenase [Desulfatibacillum alkenivorans DSM 16219]|jgi:alkylation response protein AidB-like acyl-CoA dehydrogenase|uniref:Acyl-CoA dehydrogenase n=1 Tax=Desulfatibacillum alkenivorans DSM 16219 TaxID=1121393 RepID=A0A1M6FFE6_9BACT|nr:acyl-CoA dehydrogenase family protein [Desulfatibacillum alkenivorans]SHI96441.1 Acyl-CoA dehydrogenase [Desulfatibacillum alkenivorans DSM 16219]
MLCRGDKELKLVDGAATDFAAKELAPNREEYDQYPFGPFWDKVVKKAFGLGFFHASLPVELDGMGLGLSGLSVILKSLCSQDASLGGMIFTNALAQEIMLIAKAEKLFEDKIAQQKDAFGFLLAFPSFNNPSEVRHLAQVKKTKQKATLSGEVPYVVLGGLGSYALLPACQGNEQDFSFYLVDLKGKGVSVSEPIFSLGLHACPAVDISLDKAPALLVGKEGKGKEYFDKAADRMHAAQAAMASGIMEGCFAEALAYCKEREQGGREIVDWSEVKMMLANIAIQAKSAEMMLSRACEAADNNQPKWQAAARVAAIQASAFACEAATDGVQVLGGVGYMKDHGQEKRLRDAKQIQALMGIAPMKKLKYMDSLLGKG